MSMGCLTSSAQLNRKNMSQSVVPSESSSSELCHRCTLSVCCCRSAVDLVQSLRQIRDDVVHVFDADRHAQHRGICSSFDLLLKRELCVHHAGRVRDECLRISQIRDQCDHLHGVDQ